VPVPLDASVLQHKDGIPVPGSRGLVLKGELRSTAMDGLDPGTRVLSLFLVNDRKSVERDRDTKLAFQVRMQLTYERGFVSRPNRRGAPEARATLPRPAPHRARPSRSPAEPSAMSGRRGAQRCRWWSLARRRLDAAEQRTRRRDGAPHGHSATWVHTSQPPTGHQRC
jgi:hypothetical protein